MIDIHDESRRGGTIDIIHDHAANAFQSDECIEPTRNLADNDAFRLGTFVVATVIEGVVGIGSVEVRGVRLRSDAFRRIARIKS
jgi:hypothetical protein